MTTDEIEAELQEALRQKAELAARITKLRLNLKAANNRSTLTSTDRMSLTRRG